MKLRLRSLQTGETVKLQVPNNCTLQQLIEILSHSVFLSSPSSLRFSLNRKDELSSSSSVQDSLVSLGITSGDLIYFSVYSDDFSPCVGSSSGQSMQEPVDFQESNMEGRQETQVQSQGLDVDFREPRLENCEISRESDAAGSDMTAKLETPFQGQGRDVEFQEPISEKCEIFQESGNPNLNCLNQEVSNKETRIQDDMASEEEIDVDSGSLADDSERITEPYFLKRVFREELGGYVGGNRLLFIAVHAVFLESGFIGLDPESGLRVDVFHLLEEQSSKSFTTSVSYTRPELLLDDNVTESVVLKFQTLGHFVNVYGSLAKSPSWLNKLCLDKYKFVPAISFLWATSYDDKSDKANANDGSYMYDPEHAVFEFWKLVKDELAYPLLIDLCEKTGLALPPCLMRLPADLKLKILESLPGVDVTKMACACNEMRYLCSNNDLWKQKFDEEFKNDLWKQKFADGAGEQGVINWKARFISSWKQKKKKRGGSFRPKPLYFRRPMPDLYVIRRVIGGDNDLLPGGLAVPNAFGQHGQATHRFQARRNFVPNCALGGFNA